MFEELLHNTILDFDEAIEVFDEMVAFDMHSEHKVLGLWRGDA